MKTMRKQSFAHGALPPTQGIGKVLAVLGLAALLSACYWQPENTDTGLAVTLRLPAEFGTASTGEVGALQTEDNAFVILVALDDRFITNEDRFYGVLSDLVVAAGGIAADKLPESLIVESPWGTPPETPYANFGDTSDQLFTSARVFGSTFAATFEGSSGAHVFSGLRADSTYIVYAYVFDGYNYSEYEALARDTVRVGETGSVSLELSAINSQSGGPLSDLYGSVIYFMVNNYGFAEPPS